MIYIPIRTHIGDLPERHVLTQLYYDIINISIFFIIMIIYNTKFDDKFIRNIIKILKITIIIAVVISVAQVFNPDLFKSIVYRSEDIGGYSIYQIRRTSIFGYTPLDMGLSYIPLLSIAIGVIYFYKKKIPVLFLILGGISALLTNTRFIIIAYFILCLQLFVVNRKKIKNIFKYTLTSMFLILLIMYIFSYIGYDFTDWYNVRLFAEGSIEETTRYKAIENFLKFYPRYWLFGNGEFSSAEIKTASRAIGSSQIHVGYLAHLVSYGFIGSFFLYCFWFSLAKKLYKTAKQTNYWGSFFAFLTFLWAQATLVHYSIFFYGLIFAFVFDKYFQDKHNQRMLYMEKNNRANSSKKK
ncbi:MAG: O-antigen ligase family protein [Bacteroidales bacterium]|nr:O-antigen ligase family protein [Bacteroidales bacterium]